MKKQLVTTLVLVFGSSVITQPGFAMMGNRPGYTRDRFDSVVLTMLFAAKWLATTEPDVLEPNDQVLGDPTTLISQSGTLFEVPANAMDKLMQLAPTIAHLISDLEGTGMSTIPLNLVSDPALYLLIQMANRNDHESLLNFIRNLSADEIAKLKNDAQFLDSQALQVLISRALDNPFALLPNEILIEIFARVGPKRRTTSWSVNRAFRQFLNAMQKPISKGGYGWTDTLPAVATIPVGRYPRTPVANGEMLYVMNHGDLTVSVIDTNTHQVVATIPIESVPKQPASHGERAYIANIQNQIVSVCDANTNQVVATIEMSVKLPSPVAYGQMLYLPDSIRNKIWIFDNNTRRLEASLNVGGVPQLPVFQGQMLYVVSWESGTVFVFDIGGYLPGQL